MQIKFNNRRRIAALQREINRLEVELDITNVHVDLLYDNIAELKEANESLVAHIDFLYARTESLEEET